MRLAVPDFSRRGRTADRRVLKIIRNITCTRDCFTWGHALWPFLLGTYSYIPYDCPLFHFLLTHFLSLSYFLSHSNYWVFRTKEWALLNVIIHEEMLYSLGWSNPKYGILLMNESLSISCYLAWPHCQKSVPHKLIVPQNEWKPWMIINCSLTSIDTFCFQPIQLI